MPQTILISFEELAREVIAENKHKGDAEVKKALHRSFPGGDVVKWLAAVKIELKKKK